MVENPTPEPRFVNDPDTNSHTIPPDPYNDRFQQFSVLEQMGYPVNLVPVPVELLPDLYNPQNDSRLAWERDTWRHHWLMPVAAPDFDDFIEDPYTPGDHPWSDDEQLQQGLASHQIRLVAAVDGGDTGKLGMYIKAIAAGEDISVRTAAGSPPELPVLTAAFVAAHQRTELFRLAGVELSGTQGEAEAVLYDDLRAQGVRPIDPEQLGGLVFDYYRLVEDICPDFLAFRHRG
jgi:hypothetical protein